MSRLRLAWDEVLTCAVWFMIGVAIAICAIPFLIWLFVEDKRFKFNLKKAQKMRDQKKAVLKTAQALCHPNNTVTTLEVKNQLIKDYPQFHWRQNVGDNSVSALMDKLATEGKFNYTDNGTYRTYSDPSYVFPSTTTTTAATPVTKVKRTYTRKNKGIPVVTVTVKRRGPIKGVKRGPYKARTSKVIGGNGVTANPTVKKTAVKKVAVKRATKNPNHNVKKVSRTKALDLIQNFKGKCAFATFIKKDGTKRTMRFELIAGKEAPDALGYLHVNDVHLVKKNDPNPLRQINMQTLEALKLSGKKVKVG